ncbi:MAG: class I SAM-dependent methyltransferase [Bacteroidota bacterium]
MDKQKYYQANEKLWDQRTAEHLDGDFYKHEIFLKTKNSLNSIELEGLGNVNGKSLLHLQCHFGQDTLSWANLGAKATGIDFSEAAIKAAKALSEQTGIPANFVKCSAYDTPEFVDEKFDIVFTSYGAICWLDDLPRWAEMVNTMLKPGGTFYLAEFHPAIYIFNFENGNIEYDYFQGDTPIADEETGTYGKANSTIQYVDYTWIHSVSKMVRVLLDQGLVLEELQEFPFSPYHCFPKMKTIGKNQYAMEFLPNN